MDDLFRKAAAGRWSLSREAFTNVVTASIERAFAGAEPSRRELDRHLAALHIEDLALAAACAEGHDAAWDHFVLEHRPVLYRAADALDPSGGAREVADALYADLYGMGDGADRRSLLRYFHGRSSLATWLRAVLAQRLVDSVRARKRVEPLPGDESQLAAVTASSADPDRPRLVRLVVEALQISIDALDSKDRLRLRSYYVMQLTLAQIGRVTGEHEATVSRHLSRTRRALRDGVERHLRERARLTAEQAARAVELVSEDPGALDLQRVMDGRKEPPPDRSREER